MKVKEFTNKLIEAIKEDPEVEQMDILFSSDEEGNSFCDDVYFGIDEIDDKTVFALYPMGEHIVPFYEKI